MKSSYLITLIMALFALSANASSTINDALRSGDFVISSQLSKSKHVAVGEQVSVIVDLETSTWFTKGTRIKRFAVDNAIVLMEQANVVNSTVRRGGKTFSAQRWEVPLYPISSGSIDVPPISILVSIKGDRGDTTGTAVTRPMQLHAHLASENMSSNVAWVVADEVSLTEAVSQVSGSDTEAELFVGDSLTRKIQVQAKGTSAMLFPNIMEPLVWSESTRVYLSQPIRSDKQVRGETSATYEQEVTLIMQQPGQVKIPAIKVLWWNPNSQQEQWLELPEQEWQVSHTFGSFVTMYWVELLISVVGGIFSIIGLAKILREIKQRDKEGRLPLTIQFWQAIQRNQEGRAQSLIYRKLYQRHQDYQLIRQNSQARWHDDAVKLEEAYRGYHEAESQVGTLRRIWRQVSK